MGTSTLSRAARGSRFLLFAGLVAVIASCGGEGCSGCDLAPLPGGALPADQTVEGGAQVRVTPAGIAKVESVVSGVIDDALGNGVCIDPISQGFLGGSLDACFRNDGTCTPGCQANLAIDSVDVLPEPGQLRVRAQFDVNARVPVRFDPPLLPAITCTLNVAAQNTRADAIVTLGINGTSGELTVNLRNIPNLAIDPSISGCGFVSDILDFVAGLFGDTVSDFVVGLLEPQLRELIAGLLPDPLGIENTLDLSRFLDTISPGARARLEARVVPGGYAFVEGGGLSLGIIAGVNADANPATRSAQLDSEPARCVPALPAPDLSSSLARSARNTFTLPPAAPFRGAADAGKDVAVGLSETFLDLAGHHAVTSGALCLNLAIPQLSVGTIGIVVPSLAELGSPEGTDPMLLVTRPQRAVDFSVGDGTTGSPSLTVRVQGLSIDFYAFLFERWVRGFTVTLDLDVGVNLDFSTDESGSPQILPVLVGLDTENIGVAVENAEFLREDPALLEAVLPSLIDVALPLLTGVLPEITLPDFLGFRLDGLALSRVSTAQDDFLAISATLAASPALARLAERLPGAAPAAQALAAPAARRALARGQARLVRVTVPSPEQIRAGLLGAGGAAPEVVIDVPARDPLGRDLEWTWNLGGGLWHPFRPGGRLALRDPAFAIQGRYELQLKARAAGDYHTLSTEAEVVPIVIDSVGPRILADRAAVSGGALVVPAVDLVSPADRVQIAIGGAGDAAPATAWGPGRIPSSVAADLADGSGQLRVWARDELGNQSIAIVHVSGLETPSADGGGGCAVAGGHGGAGGFALLGLAALVGLGGIRRRATARAIGRALLLAATAAALAALPACDCGGSSAGDDDGADDDGADDGADGPAAPTCEMSSDCADQCDPGKVPVCEDDTCLCEGDVPWGRIGEYSELALAPDGTAWVSAYNSYHGDLMVASRSEDGRVPDEAWQFVDGVPEGPVLVPGSEVRGGINEPGPNVGLYTDIAAAGDGAVMVSYFDQTSASLKLASNRGGAWSTQVVAAGAPGGGDASFEIAGQYSAITLRAGDGGPGIAFFVHVRDGDGERTELRFAESRSADPSGAGDWAVSVVDSAPVPDATGDPLPIPLGVGLYVNAARLSDDRPVVVYYDRIRGDLKTATYDAGAGAFAAPQVLDGAGVDVGWYPGLAVDGSDRLHVSYVSASNHDLLYVNTADRDVEVIDDGYRIAGETGDGLPLPELHFVGDDSGLVVGAGGPIAVYQDATSHELLVARRAADGTWTHETVAGDEAPFAGGYGFYASAGLAGDRVVMSNWVIDQPASDAWVEILSR